MLLIYRAISAKRFWWIKEETVLILVKGFFISFRVINKVFWLIVVNLLYDEFPKGFNGEDLSMHIFKQISFMLLINRVRKAFSSIGYGYYSSFFSIFVYESDGANNSVNIWLMVLFFELGFKLLTKSLQSLTFNAIKNNLIFLIITECLFFHLAFKYWR